MSYLTAPEEHGELDLLSLSKELPHQARFDGDVVIVGPWAEPDFTELLPLLTLSSLALFLGLLITKLAVVKHPAHRGGSSRSDLYKVQIRFLGQIHGLLNGQDAQLLAAGPDEPNFTDPYLLINPVVPCYRLAPLAAL